MKARRRWHFVTPAFLDERAKLIQLLVVRDAFLTILLLALLFSYGFMLFRKFTLDNIGLLLILAVVVVGIVALISTIARGGWNWEEKRASAKGDVLLAPLIAAAMTIVDPFILGKTPSLLDWLISYITILAAILVYPLLVLVITRTTRKRVSRDA